MLLRNLRSRLSAVPILATRFANPLTQRCTTSVARARGRAGSASPRFRLRRPASRIRVVATLSPARRAISVNVAIALIVSVYTRSHSDITFQNRGFCACRRQIASTYARLNLGAFSASGGFATRAPAYSRHSMRVRSLDVQCFECGYHRFHRHIAP